MTKVEELRTENIESIRRCFYDRHIYTKSTLSKKTKISLAGTTNVLQELLKRKEIMQIDDAASTGGRKSKQYLLNKDYCHIAKVTLQKTETTYDFLIKIVDLFDQVIYEENRKTKKGNLHDLEEVIASISGQKDLGYITISIPGVCVEGIVQNCDFYELEGEDAGNMIRRHTDVPFVIENDVNVSVIGYSQMYPAIKDMALIYQPACDYFGCGILIDGKLYNGYSHAAGELRYLPDYSESQQRVMLKESPEALLINRISVLQAVLDPELIAWYSDVVKEDLPVNERVKKIDNFYECIQNGLYQIGIEQIKSGGK